MLGLIGGGYWGKNLIRVFNNLNILHSICEIDDNLIEKYKTDYPNIIITKSFDDLLQNDEINMICVSLPAQMHYDYGIKVLKAKKHLYMEKPITLNIDEAIILDNIANQNNLILMTGHILHYHQGIKKIKEILFDKQLGDIKYITCNRKSHGIYRTYENVLWSFGVHDISIVLSLCQGTFNNVKNLKCTGKSFITKDVYDIVNLSMEINDIYVNINVDWNSPYKEQKMSIVCSKGMILFDDVEKENKVKIFYNHINDISDHPIANKSHGTVCNLNPYISPLESECIHFIECCNTLQNPITHGKEAIEVLKVLKQCDKILNKNMNNYFCHETSIINDGCLIKDDTKIWQWCHITKEAVIGKGCNIGQNCYISGTLGDGCKVQNNVSVYKGIEAGNNVFFGPSCVLTNDINPRCEYSKNGEYIKTIIEDGVSIGANATIICGNKIGKYSLIGAGAVITKDVEPFSIMVGNPATKIGTINKSGDRTLLLT